MRPYGFMFFLLLVVACAGVTVSLTGSGNWTLPVTTGIVSVQLRVRAALSCACSSTHSRAACRLATAAAVAAGIGKNLIAHRALVAALVAAWQLFCKVCMRVTFLGAFPGQLRLICMVVLRMDTRGSLSVWPPPIRYSVGARAVQCSTECVDGENCPDACPQVGCGLHNVSCYNGAAGFMSSLQVLDKETVVAEITAEPGGGGDGVQIFGVQCDPCHPFWGPPPSQGKPGAWSCAGAQPGASTCSDGVLNVTY